MTASVSLGWPRGVGGVPPSPAHLRVPWWLPGQRIEVLPAIRRVGRLVKGTQRLLLQSTGYAFRGAVQGNLTSEQGEQGSPPSTGGERAERQSEGATG